MIEITPRLDKYVDSPLYFQLYKYIKEEIQRGGIVANSKLPSIRKLSEYLNISRNTIESAYHQLLDEGYVESRPRSGLYVVKIEKTFLPLQKNNISVETHYDSEPKRFSYDFSYGKIDTDHFPFSVFRKITNQSLYSDQKELLLYGDPQGEYDLRLEIAKYLRHSRGVMCSPNQIIIGSGTQQSLSLVCQLIENQKTVAIEEPGYDGARTVFKNHNFELEPILVESDGINVEKLKKGTAEIAYITPSHQFPCGMIMPVSKRMDLLRWAKDCNGLIIEDDYDSEFRYHGRPIPSLQGMDSNGNVVYIGTFSKSLIPSIRMNYMVLPEKLLKIYHENFSLYEPTVSRIHQKTLYEFMKQGYWTRHIRKMRNIYQKKHYTLTTSIRKYFNEEEKPKIIGEESGLHILLDVWGRSERDLISAAENVDIKVYPTSRYWYDKSQIKHPNVLLGFGGMTEEEIEQGIKKLSKVWNK